MSWDRFLYALKYSGDWTWLAVAIRQPALHETQMAPYLVARMARLLDLSAPTLGMLSPGCKGSSWISAVDFKPKPPLPQKLKTTHPAQAFWQTTFPRTFIYTDSEDQVIPGHRENIKLTQPGKVTWLIKQLVAQDHLSTFFIQFRPNSPPPLNVTWSQCWFLWWSLPAWTAGEAPSTRR